MAEDNLLEAFRPAFAGAARAIAFAAALLLAASAASPAQAQARRIETAFNVQPVSFVVLPGGGPVGEEREVEQGAVIMRTRIGYSAVAVPQRDVPLTLADVAITITAGTRLFEATPLSDTRRSLGEGVRIFCDREQDSRGAQPPSRGRGLGRRFQVEIRPCLLDRDRDGRFDSAILIGARWPQDWRITEIPAVFYNEANGVPIPNSELSVYFTGGALFSGASLQLGGRIMGVNLITGAVRVQTMDAARRTDGSQGVAADAYPNVVTFGSARISILRYDRELRRVRLRVDQTFDTMRLLFNFVVHGRTIFILS
jgi:hypothetical protein